MSMIVVVDTFFGFRICRFISNKAERLKFNRLENLDYIFTIV